MPVNAPNEQLDLIAPDFELLSVDNDKYSFNSIAGEKGTVIVFICNHCPYVIAIAERLSFEANELKKISINTAAMMFCLILKILLITCKNFLLSIILISHTYLIILRKLQKNIVLFVLLISLDLTTN